MGINRPLQRRLLANSLAAEGSIGHLATVRIHTTNRIQANLSRRTDARDVRDLSNSTAMLSCIPTTCHHYLNFISRELPEKNSLLPRGAVRTIFGSELLVRNIPVNYWCLSNRIVRKILGTPRK